MLIKLSGCTAIMDMVQVTTQVVNQTAKAMVTTPILKVSETVHGPLTTHGGEHMEAIIQPITGTMDRKTSSGTAVVLDGAGMELKAVQLLQMQMETISLLETQLLTPLMKL